MTFRSKRKANTRIKRNKMRAVKKRLDGHNFDSTGEALRYADLKLLEKAGKITNLQLQVKFVIIPSIWFDKKARTYHFEKINKHCINLKREHYYRADFTYYENKVFIVEDYKGFSTREFIKNKRDMKRLFDIEVLETKYKDLTKKRR